MLVATPTMAVERMGGGGNRQLEADAVNVGEGAAAQKLGADLDISEEDGTSVIHAPPTGEEDGESVRLPPCRVPVGQETSG